MGRSKCATFYTLMVQRQALLEGSELAQKMTDPFAAKFYYQQSKLIEIKLNEFIHPQENFIRASLNYNYGLNYKKSNLDIAIILALLHTGPTNYFGYGHPAVENTIQKLEAQFQNIYKINQQGLPATLLGRYPEDQFYGGNPWILCTLALAEYSYQKSIKLMPKQKTQALLKGEQILERLQYHSQKDYSLNEQFDRDTGHMKAAENLTWSHASFLSTIKARQKSLKKF